jgi:chemotaxis protein CheD
MVIAANLKILMAGLGEIQVSSDPEVVLSCLGLGSCIGLCLYDPVTKTAGVAHIVLPKSNGDITATSIGKFADTAVPYLLKEMAKQGALKSRLIAKMVGGAQLMKGQDGIAALGIGPRNIEMTKQMLAMEGVKIAASDVGGNCGRSLKFEVSTGTLTVKGIGGTPQVL